ncbi:helix-turn-helix transcriptional regulator [Microbispora hainanensis]|uniref:helix-turn-helix transcriptional regulator n=1 Tax=Microbispora hainanensis TaxID=568844 RepID=UPI00142EE33F|nr:HTH domain-containing protein [Microbispora hainanensis]
MTHDESPTARALLLLELIQSSPGITAERLAGRLGVSERAARRYVGILREAGIPVESERGPHGGYRIGRGLRLPPLMFTQAEALGLVMAVLDGHHDSADPADPVGGALGKILRVLPEPVAGPAAAVRSLSTRHPEPGARPPSPETTAALVQACAGRRRLRLGYRIRPGDERVMEVDPWPSGSRAAWAAASRSTRPPHAWWAARTNRTGTSGSSPRSGRPSASPGHPNCARPPKPWAGASSRPDRRAVPASPIRCGAG